MRAGRTGKCNFTLTNETSSALFIKETIFSYQLHDHILEKVNRVNYLGLTLLSNFKWDKQINSITNMAHQALLFSSPQSKI